MSDFLFSLPTWLIILLVLASCGAAFLVYCALVMAGLADERMERARQAHIEKVERRMIELNRRDVETRKRFEEFKTDYCTEIDGIAWYWPGEEPYATRVMRTDGMGRRWST